MNEVENKPCVTDIVVIISSLVRLINRTGPWYLHHTSHTSTALCHVCIEECSHDNELDVCLSVYHISSVPHC